MKFGKLQVQICFYRKNMNIRGRRLWEIIPMNTGNSRGFIISLYFTHIFVDLEDCKFYELMELDSNVTRE